MQVLEPVAAQASHANLFVFKYKGVLETVYDNEKDLDAGVGQTARWAAAMRAVEHTHPKALFKDPFARIFAGESAMQKVRACMGCYMKTSSPNSHSHIAIRGKAFDEIIEEELSVHQGQEVVQVVNLGAGMCTRAWRLNFPSEISWYEVDRPESIRLREKLVRSIGRPPQVGDYCMIPVDLSQSMDNMWDLHHLMLSKALKKRSFDTKAPTIVVMEGLLMYLSIADIQKLANELNELISGSACIVASCLNDGFLHDLQNPGKEREKAYPATGQVKDLFVSSWEGGTQQAFEDAGWIVDFVMPLEEFAETHLDCEMVRYPFPDRATCTEYIIVMQRPKRLTTMVRRPRAAKVVGHRKQATHESQRPPNPVGAAISHLSSDARRHFSALSLKEMAIGLDGRSEQWKRQRDEQWIHQSEKLTAVLDSARDRLESFRTCVEARKTAWRFESEW